MQALFTAFLNAGISGSVMIAVVAALRLLLKRAPRSLVCLLWLLVMIRLVCPFTIPALFSLQPDLQYTPDTLPFIETNQQEHISYAPPIALDPGEFPTPQVSPDGVQTPQLPEPAAVPLSVTAIAGIVWLSGAGIMVLYAAISYLRLRRKVRGAIPGDGYFQIYDLNTAFVLGFLKPRIYLPVELGGDCRDHVLAHERAHIARCDHWLKLLSFIALALHWYNPLVWISYRLLSRDIETACDQRVIAGKDAEFRRSYSAALLKCSARTTVHACPIAFAEISVKDRIKDVLNYRKSAFWVSIVAVAAIVCVAVFLMTDPVEKPDDPVNDDTIALDPGTFPTPELEPGSADIWGLTFWADNVTTEGCSMHFWQQGGLPGDNAEAALTMGAMFWIQRFDGIKWEPLKPIAKVQWDAILYMLPLDNSLTLDINWSHIYGSLPAGTYRIGKEITGPDGTVREYFAEFAIGTQTYEVEIPETFRDALEEFQSRGDWLLWVSHSYEEPHSEETWWISGENWLVSSEVAGDDVPHCTMYRDGAWYEKRGIVTADENTVWYQSSIPYGLQYPWLLTLKWDESKITVLEYEEYDNHQGVTLRWQEEDDTMVIMLWLENGKLNSASLQTQLTFGNNPSTPYFSTVTVKGGTGDFFRDVIGPQVISSTTPAATPDT